MKSLFLIILFILYIINPSFSRTGHTNNWDQIVNSAQNKTVKLHAWGGSKNINNYINWVKAKVYEKYDIKLQHIKIKDTSDAVKKVLFEKIAKKNDNGSVDIIWINGENFLTMKKNNLLLNKNWILQLPNSKFIDFSKSSAYFYDFGIFNEGKEMPWGLSQLIFYYDSDQLKIVPKSASQLKNFIKKNPGRFTFPQPPDFIGTSFLKQILIEVSKDKKLFYDKYNLNNDKHKLSLNELWNWFDEITPFLWKSGKTYPNNYLSLGQLFSDNELDMGLTFNIAYPKNEISKGNFKSSVKSFIPNIGSLANTHYLTIPYNATNKNASKVVINYMISPEAQLEKQNSEIWGDPSVLSFEKLNKNLKKDFENLLSKSTDLSFQDLEKKIPEPHPSWVKVIEEGWIARYGSIN